MLENQLNRLKAMLVPKIKAAMKRAIGVAEGKMFWYFAGKAITEEMVLSQQGYCVIRDMKSQ